MEELAEEKVFTTLEACNYLGVSTSVIYNSVHDGRLICYKRDNKNYYTQSELDRFRERMNGALHHPAEESVTEPDTEVVPDVLPVNEVNSIISVFMDLKKDQDKMKRALSVLKYIKVYIDSTIEVLES